MVSAFILSVKINSFVWIVIDKHVLHYAEPAEGACCMLKIPGTCDRLHAQGRSQSDNWEHENSREQQQLCCMTQPTGGY